ncbi:MAG: AsmA family protein [Bacteroidaceae bacterium]|nr:AsmA family protein [Bacteroidaceae bacterium]
MKKIAKITGIVIACILSLMFILPFAFQGKIKEVVIAEGNKMLNAEFGFDGLNISLFRDFPKASVGLEGFWLKGINEFENDTLLYAGEVQVAVDVMSLFGDTGFDISKVLLADTKVKAIVLEDGRPNWDVMKPDTTTVEEEDTTSTGAFRIKLQQLKVDNLSVIYDDRQSNMYADIQGFNATCSGDMTADNTLLNLEALIQALTFKMDGVPFLSKARIAAELNVDADLKNSKFTLKENTVALNAIKAGIDGWVAMPADAPMNMDLKLKTSDINFKEILSLIPAIYAKDFETLKANGTVSLNAFAKGEMVGDSILPLFEADMMVKDGSFRYPALPAGVEAINVTASVKNPGGPLDATEVNVSPFSFSMLGNAFAITAQVKTPISDPDFNLTANGTLDLGQIKNVYPLEEMSLNGVVKADMNLSGRLSYIDKEMYDKFNATGSINLRDMVLTMKDMPNVSIEKSTFAFTPKYLNLSETTVHIGNNDITADCRFENYLAFALKGKTLKGQLNVQSNHFNLNDFMTAEGDTVIAAATDTTATTASEATGVIVVPKNIDFNMNVDMAEILFDKIAIKNLDGKLLIKNGTVDMKNLSMNTMGGSVVMNGAYSTAQSETSPTLNASFAMNGLSFSQTFKELDMVQKMAPIFENLKGNFSGKMQLDTRLDSVMSPIFSTTNGSGSLSTKNLNLSGVAILDKIADATNYSALKNLNVKDMNIDFTIKEGRVNTKPFDIKVGNMNLNLSGSTGLDQTIDYTGKLKLPASAGNIAALTTIDLKIGGTFTSPKVSVDTKSMAKQAAAAATNKAIEAIGDKLGVDLSDAEKQKETLVNAAKQAAESLVREAEKQKVNLVNKAGDNVLKKLAAEKAGEAIVNEAKKQGDRLIEEAIEKGDALIEKAKKGEATE